MKITLMVPFFPPKWRGGVEISTYKIAKHLAQRGHEVSVITSLDKGLPVRSSEQGFFVYRTRYPRIKIIGIMIFWLGIWLILTRINPDVVHGQTANMALPALLNRKMRGKPYYIWGQGSEIYLRWLFKKQYLKLIFKHASMVIALTEDMRREIREICDRQVVVVPNGVDLNQFENVSGKDIRRQLEISVGRKVIVFVGRLHPIKGLGYLVRAMKLVKERNKDAVLVMVGGGEEKGRLEKLAADLGLLEDIRFVDSVASEEVPRFLMASDVFVLPSMSEGFPNVILEAMACGLPIVATRVGGLPEIIEDGKNGLLVEPGNPEQIAGSILQLLGDDRVREKISENNREKVKNYDWERVIDKLEEIYRAYR